MTSNMFAREEPERTKFLDPSDEDVLRRLKITSQKCGGEYPKYRVYDPRGRRAVVKETLKFDGYQKENDLWVQCDPFVQAFVYEKGRAPMVLVGWKREVELYIREELRRSLYHLMLYFRSMFGNGPKKMWETNTELLIESPRPPGSLLGGRRKYRVFHPDIEEELCFRTLPKKWLSEYDDMLEAAK